MFTSTAIVLALATSALACSPSKNFRMTFYGWPDNSPPGPKVAMNCAARGGKASGTGTYANPLTMAAAKGRFSNCEIVYSPYLKKYLRMEDECATCSGDWVDVWTGSATSDPGSGVKTCQNSLTGKDASSHALLQAPPDNMEVDATDLYSNGKCNTANVYPANMANASCAGGSTVVAAAAAAPATASSPAVSVPEVSTPSGSSTKSGKSKAESSKTGSTPVDVSPAVGAPSQPSTPAPSQSSDDYSDKSSDSSSGSPSGGSSDSSSDKSSGQSSDQAPPQKQKGKCKSGKGKGHKRQFRA